MWAGSLYAALDRLRVGGLIEIDHKEIVSSRRRVIGLFAPVLTVIALVQVAYACGDFEFGDPGMGLGPRRLTAVAVVAVLGLMLAIMLVHRHEHRRRLIELGRAANRTAAADSGAATTPAG